MIKPFRLRLMAGISLLLLGGLLLLQSFGVIPEGDWFWSIPFIIAGIGFLTVFLNQKSNWWAVIPGVVLLDLGLIIVLAVFFPKFSDVYSGAIFLGGIGLSFVLVYLMQKRNWWAVIPAGVLTTLALVTLVSEWGFFDAGAVFFLGLAATFALLAHFANRFVSDEMALVSRLPHFLYLGLLSPLVRKVCWGCFGQWF